MTTAPATPDMFWPTVDLWTETGWMPTPHLVLDLDRAVQRLEQVAGAFGAEAVHYAVTANPNPDLVHVLAAHGCRFDVASPTEVDLCRGAGSPSPHLVYSNPMKRRADIAYAFDAGVRTFVADSVDEIDKLADTAPGSAVLVRMRTSGAGSDWPLSRFGAAPSLCVDLLEHAVDRGLDAAGVAFHLGSQQRDPAAWEEPIANAAAVFALAHARGHRPWLLDVGGGFPAAHDGDYPAFAQYAAQIRCTLREDFGAYVPHLIVEPGRGIVGDAGRLVAEVVGVAWRGDRRWVHLDAGVFTGLAGLREESVRCRITTDRDGDAVGPAVLAGPTCDSADVLDERIQAVLPLSLCEGDRVVFCSAGAYTASRSTVGNGFASLTTYLR